MSLYSHRFRKIIIPHVCIYLHIFNKSVPIISNAVNHIIIVIASRNLKKPGTRTLLTFPKHYSHIRQEIVTVQNGVQGPTYFLTYPDMRQCEAILLFAAEDVTRPPRYVIE